MKHIVQEIGIKTEREKRLFRESKNKREMYDSLIRNDKIIVRQTEREGGEKSETFF